MILISVAVLALITFFIFRWQNLVEESRPPRVTRVDVFPDRLIYRNASYATPSTLSIALKASADPPKLIEVHGCEALSRLGAVVDVVRAEGAADFEIVLPEDC